MGHCHLINLLLSDNYRYGIFMKKCYLLFQTKIFYETYVLLRKMISGENVFGTIV